MKMMVCRAQYTLGYPTLGKGKQEGQELTVLFVYAENLRPAWAT